jgi:hypothetical protein
MIQVNFPTISRENTKVKDLAKSVVLSSVLVWQGMTSCLYGQQTAPQSPAPQQATPASAVPSSPSSTTPPSAPATLKLPEGVDVPLTFDQDLSSKTANEGDPVELLLAEDLKVGDVVVAKAGCKAVGEVTNAKKAGMMGKAGELNIRVNYLKVGDQRVHLRGSKGKEGASSTGAAVALTVLFGPIGLIKHGKNIDIKKGTPLKVYTDNDVSLPPAV